MISTAKEEELTAARAREVLDYDPATGVFVWLTRPIRAGFKNVSTWNARYAGKVAGHIRACGHRAIIVDGVVYYAHRLAWLHFHGKWPLGDLDHRDTCPDHNWIENLRLATESQNIANSPRRKDNSSGFKGVTFSRACNKWKAEIVCRGQYIYLGVFDAPHEAHAAYVAKAKELFGQFANGG